jgi:hypothetical protein
MTSNRVHADSSSFIREGDGPMREGGVPLSSSSAGNEHRSEAHRALQESRSVDRVWNFALEELGRMNINFNPAWMSGKTTNLQNSQ